MRRPGWLSRDDRGSMAVELVVAALGFALLLVLVSGTGADRVDRRRLMVTCDGVTSHFDASPSARIAPAAPTIGLRTSISSIWTATDTRGSDGGPRRPHRSPS